MVPKKVLLVDDDADFTDMYKKILEEKGYQVREAFNGKECLKQVKADKPDLIVLDVMMPGLNGYDTCSALKSDLTTRAIPVILLTAVAANVSKTKYTHRQGMQVEAEDYLDKPVNASRLLSSVKNLIG